MKNGVRSLTRNPIQLKPQQFHEFVTSLAEVPNFGFNVDHI